MNSRVAIAIGIVLGLIYTLSPLTVLSLAALVSLTWWAGRDLDAAERRWFLSAMVLGVAVRLLLVAALFLMADPSRPFATFFGDEEIFKTRPIWLRNAGLGVPISAADFIYAFDETGMSGHLYVLAYLQALVGDAPYGAHLFNIVLYIASSLALFRLVRRQFGPLPAMGGLLVLLFMPSLFSWSISALKEPVYWAASVAELLCAVAIVRAPTWPRRLAAAVAVVVLAFAMEDMRKGTMTVAALGTVVGIAGGLTVQRPRLLLASMVLVPLAVGFALTRPAVESRLLTVARESIRYHVGHIMTPGVAYKIVNHRYYSHWGEIQEVGPKEATAYVVKAVGSYFLEPTPPNWQSPMLWAFLPEHLLWLVLIVLVPVGAIEGLRRDPVLTVILLAHAAAIVMMVALTSGNIGTLIRHRGSSLTYLVWLSMLGATALLARALPREVAKKGMASGVHG